MAKFSITGDTNDGTLELEINGVKYEHVSSLYVYHYDSKTPYTSIEVTIYPPAVDDVNTTMRLYASENKPEEHIKFIVKDPNVTQDIQKFMSQRV